MLYVIQRNDGAYLNLDAYKRISYTTNKCQGYINDEEKITNFFNNCLSPKDRDTHSIVPFNDDVLELPTILNPPKYPIAEMIDNILRFTEDDFDCYKKALHQDLIAVNDEQQDILHYIEFNNLDVFKGYKAYKMLHDCRQRRRVIKDEITKLEIFRTSTWDNLKDGKVTERINKFDDREYTPRALTKLFEV